MDQDLPKWCLWVRCWRAMTTRGYQVKALADPDRAIIHAKRFHFALSITLLAAWLLIMTASLMSGWPALVVATALLGVALAFGLIHLGTQDPDFQAVKRYFPHRQVGNSIHVSSAWSSLWEFHLRVLLETPEGRAHMQAHWLQRLTPGVPVDMTALRSREVMKMLNDELRQMYPFVEVDKDHIARQRSLRDGERLDQQTPQPTQSARRRL